MENSQLYIPLLSKVFPDEANTKLSTITSSVVHFLSKSLEPELQSMKTAIFEINSSFGKILPNYIHCPYGIVAMEKLPDETHFLAATYEGYALIFDIKTGHIDDKKICEKLNDVKAFPFARKSVFLGDSSIFTLTVPNFSIEEIKFVSPVKSIGQSADKKELYVLLENELVKIEPPDFINKEVILTGENYWSLCMSHHKKFAIANKEGKLAIYDLKIQKLGECELEKETIVKMFSSSETKVVTMNCKKKVIKVIEISACEIISEIKINDPDSCVAITNDEKTLIYSEHLSIIFWNIQAKKIEGKVNAHEDKIRYLGLSMTNDCIYSCGIDGKFSILKYPEFSIEKTQKATKFEVNPWNGDIIINRKNELRLWDFDNGLNKEIDKLENFNRKFDILNIKVVDEYTIICLYSNCVCKINTTTNEKKIFKLSGDRHDSFICAEISPNGKLLATGGHSQKLCLWDIETMVKQKEFKGHDNYIHSILFLKASNIISSGCATGMVRFWDLETEKEVISALKSSDKTAEVLKVIKDETVLIIGCSDGTITIWKWREKLLLNTLNPNGGSIKDIYIVPDELLMITCSYHGKISFWCLKTYSRLFYYDTKSYIWNLRLTDDAKYFMYIDSRTNINEEVISYKKCEIVMKPNPMISDNVQVCGHGNNYDYMKYVTGIISNRRLTYDPNMDNLIILPYKINTLHLYSYFNRPALLKAALSHQASLFNNIYNQSPLSLSASKGFESCLNVIISSMEKYLSHNPYSFSSISNSTIIVLNKSGYSTIDNFYRSAFKKYEGYRTSKFCDDSVHTPIFRHSNDPIPIESDFLSSNDKAQEEKPIKFMHSLIACGLSFGTKDSIDFLNSIKDSPNSRILVTKFIQSLLDYKWNKLKWMMYAQAIAYFMFMLLLSIYVLDFIDAKKQTVVLLAFSTILTLYEVYQFYSSPRDYIKDIWNYVDLIRSYFTINYAIFIWLDYDSVAAHDFLAYLVIVSWLRGIAYFRLFKNTRYMVNLLTEVVKDMFSFLILLFYSTAAFSFIFTVLDDEGWSYLKYLTISYRIDLGDFDTSYMNSMQWLFFVLATMSNMIIMLNLLISIMSITLDRVQEFSEIADKKELVGMIIELETLLFWRRNLEGTHYFQVCQEDKADDKDKNMATRVHAIKRNLKQFQNDTRHEIHAVVDEVRGLKEAVMEMKETLKSIAEEKIKRVNESIISA